MTFHAKKSSLIRFLIRTSNVRHMRLYIECQEKMCQYSNVRYCRLSSTLLYKVANNLNKNENAILMLFLLLIVVSIDGLRLIDRKYTNVHRRLFPWKQIKPGTKEKWMARFNNFSIRPMRKFRKLK